MATIIDLAETVKTDLNAATFTIKFLAARKYLPRYKLEDMDCLHVTVVPRNWNAAVETRISDTVDYVVDVAVQRKFSTGVSDVDRDSDVDRLMSLTEEIMDFFKRYAAGTFGTCILRVNDPIYSPEHMEQFRQFTSVISLTFRKVF